MADILVEDDGTDGRSSVEEIASEQLSQSGESLAEWRSAEQDQADNGAPSTSPAYSDTEDDDLGPSLSELYGRFTWKIDSFSTINKRELRSNPFDVGGYKWYILIYPQGCDVCNHLSLFLCVADHEKLLPGWSYFAQFTIAVINRDPTKSKYSDTLHRFCKKEHDWGWKKFVELSLLHDGFVVDDVLIIKAQVQVIRFCKEKADRPFRSLDCQYRRELVRVYIRNVEQSCRRFVDERRGKICRLTEDKLRWSSFNSFWLGIDSSIRRYMSRERTDTILKAAVKHFFIEKEVTSTLVMDSLYGGLKVLECQGKNKKAKATSADMELQPALMVLIDQDMFVLADDVVTILQRVASEALPNQPVPTQDCSQDRTKEGSSGDEFSKDRIVRDDRRLIMSGLRTLEFFILSHIFSRIEVAFQEAVAFKRQEELIREEEAATVLENELKEKRGAADKDKRAKKKQAKQKRANRKGKGKDKGARVNATTKEVLEEGIISDDIILDEYSNDAQVSISKDNHPENATDISDNEGDVLEALQRHLDDREESPVNWETDATVGENGSRVASGKTAKKSKVMDDSSSTCSSDSVPSVISNASNSGSAWTSIKNQASHNRRRNQQNDTNVQRTLMEYSSRQPMLEMEDKRSSPSVKKSNHNHQGDPASALKPRLRDPVSLNSGRKPRGIQQRKLSPESTAKVSNQVRDSPIAINGSINGTAVTNIDSSTSAQVLIRELPASAGVEKLTPSAMSSSTAVLSPLRSDALKHGVGKSVTASPVTVMSRPPSAPPVMEAQPSGPAPSMVDATPSVSGRSVNEQSLSAASCIPRSYRNAMMDKGSMTVMPTCSRSQTMMSPSPSPVPAPSPPIVPSMSIRTDLTSLKPGFTFGTVKAEQLSPYSWTLDCLPHEVIVKDSDRDAFRPINWSNRRDFRQPEMLSSAIQSPDVAHYLEEDEFPHLDIINDLLDEEPRCCTSFNGTQNHYCFSGSSATPAAAISSLGSYLFDRNTELSYYYDKCRMAYRNLPRHDLLSHYSDQLGELVHSSRPYSQGEFSALNSLMDVNARPFQPRGYASLAARPGPTRYSLQRHAANGL